MQLFYVLAVLATTLSVLAQQDTCGEPRMACQWSGHYLGAAWSDRKFTGGNYRKGSHIEYYSECCDLCHQAVGCYKFHVMQVVAPDPDEPGSGLVNCFLHGQGGKEFCYNMADAPPMNVLDDSNSTLDIEGDMSIPLRRRRLQIGSQNPSSSGSTGTSTGTGGGDPHLIGFDGRPFDFQGYDGGVFNLLTQSSHNLNMLLTDNEMAGLTFIRTLAFQYADKRIKVEAAPYKNTTTGLQEALLVVEFNGMSVEVAALDSDNEPARLEAGDFWLSSRRAGNNTQEIHLTTPGLQVVVKKERDSRHLDLTTSILRADMEPMHGILGQTYRFNATFAQFEGDEMDYLVSGLWGNDCKYCTLFAGTEMPLVPVRNVGEDSARRSLASSETPLKSAKTTVARRSDDWDQSDLFAHIL